MIQLFPIRCLVRLFGSVLLAAGAVVLISAFAAVSVSPVYGQTANTIPRTEPELLAILTGSGPDAEKALACKYLAVYGSETSVPELARLLTNEQLASWARIALEAIPGPAADSALRNAMETVTGQLLIGVINSVGVRRDVEAVGPLMPRLQNADPQVAAAAALALGRIGTKEARIGLQQALNGAPNETRGAIAEGCILCAERALATGEGAEATSLYELVRQADVPRPRILEATRGAILARQQAGIDLLKETLHSGEQDLFRLGLTVAREFPGAEVDKALAADLDGISPERAALIVMALADRSNTVNVASFLNIASQGPTAIRTAAIDALGRVGDASCLSPLLAMAADSNAEIASRAKHALAALPGASINDELKRRLSEGKGPLYVMLIEVIGERRIDAVAELVHALNDSDKTVRTAALNALGNTVPLASLSELVSRVVSPRDADEGAIAQQALKTAAVRMPDRDACATLLRNAMSNSSASARKALLETLAAVGGTEALNAVVNTAKTGDPALQDIASRLLGEWMTADAAPALLDLAGSTNRYQGRALRGYLRIARQFALPDPERIEMCRQALTITRQPAEKKLILDILKRYPTPAGFQMAADIAKIPELKDDATQTALAIAQGLGMPAKDLSEVVSRLSPAQVEIIKGTYGNDKDQRDVTVILRKHVSGRPLILLPSTSYNEVFGDPAAGSVKQLHIEYRLNGKSGKVSLAENALILLPSP